MRSTSRPLGRLVTLLFFTLIGCSAMPSPTEPPTAAAHSVTILNVDGPDLQVRLNEAVVGTATCGGPVLVLREFEAGLPSLPWSLEFVWPDGRVFGTVVQDVTNYRPYITIRGDALFAADTLGVGPAPAGSQCPTR